MSDVRLGDTSPAIMAKTTHAFTLPFYLCVVERSNTLVLGTRLRWFESNHTDYPRVGRD